MPFSSRTLHCQCAVVSGTVQKSADNGAGNPLTEFLSHSRGTEDDPSVLSEVFHCPYSHTICYHCKKNSKAKSDSRTPQHRSCNRQRQVQRCNKGQCMSCCHHTGTGSASYFSCQSSSAVRNCHRCQNNGRQFFCRCQNAHIFHISHKILTVIREVRAGDGKVKSTHDPDNQANEPVLILQHRLKRFSPPEPLPWKRPAPPALSLLDQRKQSR